MRPALVGSWWTTVKEAATLVNIVFTCCHISSIFLQEISSTTAGRDEVGVFLKQTSRKKLPAMAPTSRRQKSCTGKRRGRLRDDEVRSFRARWLHQTTPGNVLEPPQVHSRRLLWPRLLCGAPAGLCSANTAALNIKDCFVLHLLNKFSRYGEADSSRKGGAD